MAGWGSPSTSSLGPTGISHRFPFARFDSKSRADLAAEALQERVAESVRNPTSDYSLAEANPRFVVLSEDEMSPAEFISAREKLTRFGDPSRKPVSEEETLARICFLMLRSTLDQIASLQEPVVEQSAGPWEELYSLVTSLRLKGKQKKAVIALVEARGSVPIADLTLMFGWMNPPDNWNSMKKALDKIFRKRGWVFSQATITRPFRSAALAVKNRSRTPPS